MLSILTSLKPLIENKYDINCKWINVKVRFISFVFVWLGLSPRHLCSYITHTMRATQTSIGHAENTLKLEESVRERRRDTHEERGLFWETVVRLNSIPPGFFFCFDYDSRTNDFSKDTQTLTHKNGRRRNKKKRREELNDRHEVVREKQLPVSLYV